MQRSVEGDDKNKDRKEPKKVACHSFPLSKISDKLHWFKIRGLDQELWSSGTLVRIGNEISFGKFEKIATETLRREGPYFFRIFVTGDPCKVPAVMVTMVKEKQVVLTVEWDPTYEEKFPLDEENYGRELREFYIWWRIILCMDFKFKKLLQ